MRKLSLLAASLALVAALALSTAPSEAGKKSTKITVGNNFFSPEKKTINKGTKVKFKWAGGVPHDVTKKKGPGGKFQSDLTSESGVNFKQKFKKPGTYRIFCTIHPDSMNLRL
ncbi:MAG: cupredoxin domain-containing protein, partial [Solirubrobacterales bacterium]